MRHDRDAVAAFLARAGYADAVRQPLAGDASTRRYERLAEGPEPAILMLYPDGSEDAVDAFVRIGRHLAALGHSAPRVLDLCPSAGLILVEDLGDALFAKVLQERPAQEADLYAAATDFLTCLHGQTAPVGLPVYTAKVLTEALEPAWTWLAESSPDAAILAELETVFAALPGLTDTVILRDFHAENLIWLPDRADTARVGVIDFQDAMMGHRAYDLVSLLQDARRDVGPYIQEQMIDRYCAATGAEDAPFRRAFALLGFQRNLRILGIFARLSKRDGRHGYLRLMPRVAGHLRDNLRAADLGDLGRDIAARIRLSEIGS